MIPTMHPLGKFFRLSPFTGQAMTCHCARVLKFDRIEEGYRAVCCGVPYFEPLDMLDEIRESDPLPYEMRESGHDIWLERAEVFQR